MPEPAERDALVAALLGWFDREARDLPWRRTRDPYAIWLSEVMLQQTRVDTVIPYHARFLARWPTVEALAAAELDEVLREWSGLGYYRRARQLHLAAREVVERYAGKFPPDVAALRGLAGVGAYTAGAVASIAFDVSTPLVDGNVIRVLSRRFGLEDDMRTTRGTERVWTLAAGLVPERRSGAFNQALMELGSQVCTPRAPRCESCPIASDCVARATGRGDELPVLAAKKAPLAEGLVAAVLVHADRVLLARRRADGLFGGMWEPPLANELAGALGSLGRAGVVPPEPLTSKGTVRHVLSHRRLEVEVFAGAAPSPHAPEARSASGRGRGARRRVLPAPEVEPRTIDDGAFEGRYRELAWRTPGEVALSTLARKVLAVAGVTVAVALGIAPRVVFADDARPPLERPTTAPSADVGNGAAATGTTTGDAPRVLPGGDVEDETLEPGDLERYRRLAETSGRYARVFATVAGGTGVRFNNPFRLRSQLGATAESLSLTAPYLDLGGGLAFGDPYGWQHGPSLHASFALDGVPQSALSASYLLLRRGSSPWLGYGRAGAALLLAPDANVGAELAGGVARFVTGALGVTGELVGDLFYGAGTYEKRYTVVPVVSLQLGVIVDLEVLP